MYLPLGIHFVCLFNLVQKCIFDMLLFSEVIFTDVAALIHCPLSKLLFNCVYISLLQIFSFF